MYIVVFEGIRCERGVVKPTLSPLPFYILLFTSYLYTYYSNAIRLSIDMFYI